MPWLLVAYWTGRLPSVLHMEGQYMVVQVPYFRIWHTQRSIEWPTHRNGHTDAIQYIPQTEVVRAEV